MAEYVVLADGWRRPTKMADNATRDLLEWEDYSKGDVVELDEEKDKAEITRLTPAFRPAIMLKSEYEKVDPEYQRQVMAVTAARAATLGGAGSALPGDNQREFPEGQRVDAPGSAVGSGGTDPEPQGLTGEAAGDKYDDAEAYSYPELQAEARSRGISAGGSRGDLAARLREFDRLNQSELTRRAAGEDLDDDNKDVALNN